MSNDAKILGIDVETSPLEVWAWGLWDQNIPIDFLKTDWSILSYSARWLSGGKAIHENTGGRGADKVRDDSILMPGLHRLLSEADIVVAQNGKRFDVKKINARLIVHGYGPPEPYRVVDTLLVAKKYFAFSSQKLAHTSEILTGRKKDEHKEFPGFDLWKACLQDNPRAWKVMTRYNDRDVLRTLGVYRKMRPWIEDHPNMALFDERDRPLCPHCGSDKVKSIGRRSNKQVGSYTRFRCWKCGGWSRGRFTQLAKDKRKNLLVADVTT